LPAAVGGRSLISSGARDAQPAIRELAIDRSTTVLALTMTAPSATIGFDVFASNLPPVSMAYKGNIQRRRLVFVIISARFLFNK
ncbi:MAG: hypothetical protein KA296_10275, partial [Marinobacter sp.]|nr:hypothetical protein [Marinobacter sp.]